MRNIRAGALRSPVFLGRPVITGDAAGGEILTWAEFATWAYIEPLTGREWASATNAKDSVDVRISIRCSDGWMPDARWRVRDAVTGAIYNLVTVMPSGRFKSAECLARTAQGSTDGR